MCFDVRGKIQIFVYTSVNKLDDAKKETNLLFTLNLPKKLMKTFKFGSLGLGFGFRTSISPKQGRDETPRFIP